MSIENQLATYGYPLLLAGTIVEGETFLIAAAVMAHLHYFEWPWVMVVAFCGAYIGDQVFFQMGRMGCSRWLSNTPKRKERLEKARQRVVDHRIKIILVYRFLYGLRAVVPLSIGACRFPTLAFMGLSALSAVAWVLSHCVIGYLLARTYGSLSRSFNPQMGSAAIAVVIITVAAIGMLAACRFRKRAKRRV